jgi:predicted amidophosphoribosyltransferase
MVCLACQAFTSRRMCRSCEATLSPAADRLLPGGMRLASAFEHVGAARDLIHHLKYRGVVYYAEMVADALEHRLPRIPIVPVPRALSRRLQYGVDPALILSRALSRRLGVPVISALAPPLHTRRRAGRDHAMPVGPFRSRRALRFPVLVADDVVTTGATALAAVKALGPDLVRAVTSANVVSEVSNLDRRMTGPEPGGTELGKRSDR